MYKWNTYIKLSWITIIIDVFISIYLYIFGKELKHIWNTDDNIVIDKPLTITLGTYEGMLMIYLTLYILFALLKILIHQVI